jgi:hypothetical protein
LVADFRDFLFLLPVECAEVLVDLELFE